MDDIKAVAEAVHGGEAILKVIIETALLSDVEQHSEHVAAEPSLLAPRLRELVQQAIDGL